MMIRPLLVHLLESFIAAQQVSRSLVYWFQKRSGTLLYVMDTNPSKKKNAVNKQNACYVGNLDVQVTEDILWELFLQVGRVKGVRFPKTRVPGKIFAFVEFENGEEVGYAVKVLNSVQLFGKSIVVASANASKGAEKAKNIGAILFIGNLAPEVNEKLLYDTFSAFGEITQVPSLARDGATGVPKGYAFIGFGSFAASDAAIQYMNHQFMCNRQINVEYALRKGGNGERHGSHAERLLAAEAEKKNMKKANKDMIVDDKHASYGAKQQLESSS